MIADGLLAYLTDTLFMTGALMALVLLVRRPVGRWFGPNAAYALWALPMIRLLLPPLVLPGQLLPRPDLHGVAAAAEPAVETVIVTASGSALPAASAAAPAGFAMPWGDIVVAVWLAGAAAFLVLRALAYRRMRAELLAGARRIGHSGAVRIVESPAVASPVAFGVFDRVVALPAGFLAGADSDVSDFAIAHELEHHAGNDLVANLAVQPLFALHWFNPLAWAAWRALRSDQEAACDARVLVGRGREERARYAGLIAHFAAGPRLALAAPMAGPVTGDKPIVHRLRALTRPEPGARSGVAARVLFALSVVAVPATATVTYAASEPPAEPAPVSEPGSSAWAEPAVARATAAPQAVDPDGLAASGAVTEAVAAAPLPPAPPRAPAMVAPAAPPAPAAPVAAPRVEVRKIVMRNPGEAEMAANAEASARYAEAVAAAAPQVEQTVSKDGKVQTIRIVTRQEGGKVDERVMKLDSTCPADRRRAVAEASARSQVAKVVICTGEPASAVEAIRSARASIAANRDLDPAVRSEILGDLDREIADAQRGAR